MAAIDVLLPTNNRLPSLVMTLSGVATQTFTDLRVIVSDQSAEPVEEVPVLRTLRRVIEARGGTVEWHYRIPSRGIAEQRHFLLGQATADAVLFLDDDVLMEPWVIARMLMVLREQRCGFVGAFPAGLSFRDDVRPQQQRIDYWNGLAQPESVNPGSDEWERWPLHCAANQWHVGRTLQESWLYKVAWVASCVLYDRRKLREVGGFDFWERLPRFHSGEDVLVQNLLMRRWGACGLIPSGTYHAQVSSTVLNEAGRVDGHALELLPEMVRRYAPDSVPPDPAQCHG